MGVLAVITMSNEDPAFFHGSVHTATLTVCTVLTFFVVVLGIFGNGLVLLSAFQCRRRRSNVAILECNLAGTDFIICSCVSPTYLYLLFSNRQSTREFCGGLLFISMACCVMSLLTLVAIAAYRQSRIRGRLKSALSSIRTACILVVVYVISIGTALGGALHVTMPWIDSHVTCQAVMNSSDITTNNVILFFISPVVIISLIVIIVCYCIIARSVRVQTYLRVKALQPLLRPLYYKPIQRRQPSYRYFDEHQTRIRNLVSSKLLQNKEPLRYCSCCSCLSTLEKGNKAATMCFVIIIVTVFCWTPVVFSHLIELITGESLILYQVKLCGIALVFLNSALNPYIYAPNSGRMKHRYGRFLWDILQCRCRIPHQRTLRNVVTKPAELRTSKTLSAVQDCVYCHIQVQPRKYLKESDHSNAVMNKCSKCRRLMSSYTVYSTNITW